jgi:hypothetical protein
MVRWNSSGLSTVCLSRYPVPMPTLPYKKSITYKVFSHLGYMNKETYMPDVRIGGGVGMICV